MATPRTPRQPRHQGKAVSLTAGLILLGLLLVNTADVVMRTAGLGTVRGIIEWTEIIIPAVVFASLAPAFLARMHVSVDLVTHRLSPRWAATTEAFGLMVSALVLGLWTIAAARVAWASFQRREFRFGLVEVPVWPVRIVVPIGIGLFVVVVVLRIVRLVRLALRPEVSRAEIDA